jgi:hypothetical protein
VPMNSAAPRRKASVSTARSVFGRSDGAVVLRVIAGRKRPQMRPFLLRLRG